MTKEHKKVELKFLSRLIWFKISQKLRKLAVLRAKGDTKPVYYNRRLRKKLK